MQGDPDAREVARRRHAADAPPLPPATETPGPCGCSAAGARSRACADRAMRRPRAATPALSVVRRAPAGGRGAAGDPASGAPGTPGRAIRHRCRGHALCHRRRAPAIASTVRSPWSAPRPRRHARLRTGGTPESLHGLRARQLFRSSSGAPGPDLATALPCDGRRRAAANPARVRRAAAGSARRPGAARDQPGHPARRFAPGRRLSLPPARAAGHTDHRDPRRAGPGRLQGLSTAGGGTPAATSWRPWPAATARW